RDHPIVTQSPYSIEELDNGQLSRTKKKVALMITKITDVNVFKSHCLKKLEKGFNDIAAKGGQMGCIKGKVKVLAYTKLYEILKTIQYIRCKQKPLTYTRHILNGKNDSITTKFCLKILNIFEPPEKGDFHGKPI